MTGGPASVTALLKRWGAGDRDALEQLLPAVYSELRRIARTQMAKERLGHTLEPPALVHEAFLRIGHYERISWQNRAHFFAVAAGVMRRILVDHARRRRAAKRGGAGEPVTLSEAHLKEKPLNVDLLALDEALERLKRKDLRQASVVELRYFAGLSDEEIGSVLGVSAGAVKREWTVAKLWLRRALSTRR
jgi:RNA polymerase sigma factor (TIGR02999 family)